MPTVAETINKINEFAQLPQGWHFGEGVSPSEDIRVQAINLLRVASFLGVKRTNAFPGIRGELQITFYHESRVLELTLEADGSVTIAEDERDTQIVFREGASIADAYNSLGEFSQHLWPSSDQSTVSTMIRSVRTSLARHLISIDASLFPLWIESVQLLPVADSANILRHFTVSRQASRRFTGIYPPTSFRHVVGSSARELPLAMIATTISTVGEKNKRDESLSH